MSIAHDPFNRVGNDLSVDFANTIRSPDHPDGSLRRADDVLSFLVDARAIDPKEAAQTRKTLTQKRGADARFLHAVLQLRAAVRDVLEALDARKKIPTSTLATLNAFLAADAGFEQIKMLPGGRFEIDYRRTRADTVHVLAPIARAISYLLVESDSKVRKCANPDCIRYFYDNSRTSRRRWCEMAVCGNRAKAAAFLRRRRAAEPS